MYGLILDGAAGVRRVFEILESELLTAMINGGFRNLKHMQKSRIKEQ